jgi:hypothetical protein
VAVLTVLGAVRLAQKKDRPDRRAGLRRERATEFLIPSPKGREEFDKSKYRAAAAKAHHPHIPHDG